MVIQFEICFCCLCLPDVHTQCNILLFAGFSFLFLSYVGDKAESVCFSLGNWHLNETVAFLSLKKIKGVIK